MIQNTVIPILPFLHKYLVLLFNDLIVSVQKIIYCLVEK